VYAVGDVASNGFELTPVAIAAGRLLADRLFGGPAFVRARVAYDARSIPTVVFTHPPLGTVGLTEAAARAAHGDAAVKIYAAVFAPMLRAFQPAADVCKTTMKVVCVGPEETVVGLHVHGDGADEMLQGFAVAVQARLTMRDFNSRCGRRRESCLLCAQVASSFSRARRHLPRPPLPLRSAWPFIPPRPRSSSHLNPGSQPTARLTTE
jgi:pyruvate/2-oxoglutarate dehydrogenase complex dihydrolipoamide dehydrogenase (E3) component